MTTHVARPESGTGRVASPFARMARWRYWLYAWMERHEYAEWRAFGIPAEQIVVVDVHVVSE